LQEFRFLIGTVKFQVNMENPSIIVTVSRHDNVDIGLELNRFIT
jgi:hypothetical protein